jgi:zinc protease
MKALLLSAIAIVLTHTCVAQKLNRSVKPIPGPAPTIVFKDPYIYKLQNGITLLVVEDHDIPKISANYLIDAGPISESDKAGVLDLLSGMLNEGTNSKSKEEFSSAIDRMGAEVVLNSSGGRASALTRFFPESFLILADGIKNPAFDLSAFEKLKTAKLTELRADERNGPAISRKLVSALAYGSDHPYGEFPTEISVEKVKLEDIKAMYRKYITPSRGYLTIIGDITIQEAKSLTIKAFGDWKGAKLELPNLAAVPSITKTEVDIVDLPNLVQSEITLVNLVDLRMSDPDYHAVLLANEILGGGPDSKLFRNLREKHGFTYGAYSSVGAGRFQSTFTASASVRNEKVDSAIVEMITEVKLIRSEPVSEEVLQNAKNLYNGSFALGLETPGRSASFASNIILNKLEKDFYRTYLQKINAVTKDDILRVSKKYFTVDHSRIVVVGNGQIGPGIKNLGLPIKYFDINAVAVKN